MCILGLVLGLFDVVNISFLLKHEDYWMKYKLSMLLNTEIFFSTPVDGAVQLGMPEAKDKRLHFPSVQVVAGC